MLECFLSFKSLGRVRLLLFEMTATDSVAILVAVKPYLNTTFASLRKRGRAEERSVIAEEQVKNADYRRRRHDVYNTEHEITLA